MTHPSTILVAVDLEPTTARVVEHAATLAARTAARIVLLHVVEPLPYPYPVATPDLARRDLEQKLAAIAEELRARGIEARAAIAEGRAADAIVRAASERGADWIVVGSHGRRTVMRLLMGSVAEEVVRAARVPVLVVRNWRFADYAEAGRDLAALVRELDLERPMVLAISEAAVLVGAEVARALGCSLDALAIEPIDGLAAVSEDGTVAAERSAAIEPDDPRLEAARAKAVQEGARTRGSRWLVDADGRTVVVVCEAIASPWPALAAARVLRGEHAARVVVATPVGTPAALAKVHAHVDDLVVLSTLPEGDDVMSAYRAPARPSASAAARLLEPNALRA